MPVCNFPQTSSPIGQASTSCLQKFTIHFRRPEKLKQKKGAPYKGEYGFDWLRDEYIYPMKIVVYDEVTHKYGRDWNYLNKFTELCTNPKNLRQEYLKDVVPSGENFKLSGQDYYPAWLSIFACNVQGNNADAGSDIHKDGVYLDLQLDEIDTIIDDKTEIFFEPSDPCLKITPEKISISEFLKTSRKYRELNGDTHEPVIYYYLLENAVRIICQGDTLKQHGNIKVFAKLGSIENEVGRLMVYKNDNIGKANFVVVNVITEDYNNKKVIPKPHPSFKDLYNYQSFNQAMIRAEVSTIENFDLVALKHKHKDNDIISFLNDAKSTYYLDSEMTDPENPLRRVLGAELILRRLSDLYKKYGKHAPKGEIGLNERKHHNTYLFFTALYSNIATGASYVEMKSNVIEWGNVFMILDDGLKNDRTVVHEAGHSFSLTHTFERFSPHVFHKGYTDNFMDYVTHIFLDPTMFTFYTRDNPYKNKMYSFFKWQWDLMREDYSIKKIRNE